ncbi:MAG: cytochrome ubiquinol oxidase subunit I [Chlorobi bacterium]|nr:cytochrome ubiquinol oxidase subunit I [Chlorobiota bacterium]
MLENINFALVNWSRAQFALTAMYHWIFVPLTLGLGFLIAIFETLYVKTKNEEWKRITKFWAKLFGINFAIGVATGIILEFEFGTNWSNYSWFVGDIFGAPLAIEGIMAFFLESTFIAVMFFGWEKVSKKFHLLSTWLTAIGANLSALWILVANAWMQNPVGMKFNPDTARNEMVNFWDVLFSSTAIHKFLHTVSSGYVLASIFVIGVSSWYLLKNRELLFAKRSILVASVFGLFSAIYVIFTGDGSARDVAKTQPMKFAAMEALYDGQNNAPLIAIGLLKRPSEAGPYEPEDFYFKFEIPNALSYMAFLSPHAFVPGINDMIVGNEEKGIVSYSERIKKGKIAINALAAYNKAKKAGNNNEAIIASQTLEQNFKYFGYGYYENVNPRELIPSVTISFYSFHIMVILGAHFLILFIVFLYFSFKENLEKRKFILWIAIITIPLAYLAQELGWIVAELGRQPWVIQDLLPTIAAVSEIGKNSVIISFFLFAIVFTVLLIAELKILFKQIKTGPNKGGN